MAGTYGDTSNIAAGRYIYANDVKIPIDQLDTVIASIIMGTAVHAKVEIQDELLFSNAVSTAVAGGILNATTFIHNVGTGGLSVADLSTINGVPGKTQIIVVKPASNAEQIRVKHGTGNIRLSVARDYLLATTDHAMIFIGDGTSWFGIGFGSDHKHQGTDIENFTADNIVGGVPASYITGGVPASVIHGLETDDISGLVPLIDQRVTDLTTGGVSLVAAEDTSYADDGNASSGYVIVDEDTGSTITAINASSGAPSGKVNRNRGFIVSGGSGLPYVVRVHGEVDFASLGAAFTPNLPLYYNTKAGQTIGSTKLSHIPPEPTLNGGQIAVVKAGVARTSTIAFLTNRDEVHYVRRDELENGDIVEIKHHNDDQYTRRPSAYVNALTETVGEQIPIDQGFHPITVSFNAVGVDEPYDFSASTVTGTRAVGNEAGLHKAVGQIFRPLDDIFLKSFTLFFGPTFGSPIGKMKWEYRNATSTNLTTPIYETGLFTPVPNSSVTIIPKDFRAKPVYHAVNTYFGIDFVANELQNLNSYWQVETIAGAEYARGDLVFNTANAVGNWTRDIAQDMKFKVEMKGVVYRQRFAQPFIPDRNMTIFRLEVYGGNQGGALTTADLFAQIVLDDGTGQPGGTVVPGGTSIYRNVLDVPVNTNFDPFLFTFPTLPSVTAGQKYWLIIDSNYALNTKSTTWISKYSTLGDPMNMKYWNGTLWVDDELKLCHRVLGVDVLTKQPLALIGWDSDNLQGIESRFGDRLSQYDDDVTSFRLKRTESTSEVTTIVKL